MCRCVGLIKAQIGTIFRTSRTKAYRYRSHKLCVGSSHSWEDGCKTINKKSKHRRIINAIPHGIMENRFNQTGKFDEIKDD